MTPRRNAVLLHAVGDVLLIAGGAALSAVVLFAVMVWGGGHG